ncbi:hypothetical protein C922_02631 [Plasmodium inui San Antonio 1]|uniref:PCIF1 WW domain-containing protein n=1 Tax=Plasmodium inui San Antonio 1 TaxID=1237626 RepID=W7A1H6_9APIC|nr:hypothetical protein C922_02631 [Plasmodium inui San Antonio 1]EUD67047.1 hypothetical protein C922_02631 [Plasmodium inui San Antonio 1]
MTERFVGAPSPRLDLYKELSFQREIIKLRKAFLNAYTFELFYKKNLKLKNDYLRRIKRRDGNDGKMRCSFQDGERSPCETSLRRRVSCINREFWKVHHVKGHYHVDAVELKRHISFLEKETINRFLFSLRIGESSYSFDEKDTYLYRLFVRFLRFARFARRVRRVQSHRGEFGRRRSNTLGNTRDSRKDTPFFCDARYVKQFCAFVAPLLKRQRRNPHLTFLKRYVRRLDSSRTRKPKGRGKNSSRGTSLRYRVEVGTLQNGTPQNGHNKRISRREDAPIYMVLSISAEHPTCNLSVHRRRRRTTMRSFPLSGHRECLQSRQHQVEVNVAKVKHAVGRFILGHLYDNSLSSIFTFLVSRSSQFKWNSIYEDIGSTSHCCAEEEAVFSGETSHLEGSSFQMRGPTQSGISECLKMFFRPLPTYHRVETADDEFIFLQNSVLNLLQEDVRKLLHISVVNITLLFEHLPLGYLFSVFLFYFLFLNIPVGSKTGSGDFPCPFGEANPKQRNCEESPTDNDQDAGRGSSPPRLQAEGVKETEGCFHRCLLCLYDALRRNRNMTPLEKKKRLAFILLGTLRRSYVQPVDQEESILSLYFGSLMNSGCIPYKGEVQLVSYKEGTRDDEGNDHQCPVCCPPCGRYSSTRKRLKLGEGKEANPVNTEKSPRCHDVQRIFRRCFKRLNRKEYILGHLGELINSKGSDSPNGDFQKGEEGKKKNIASNCAMYSPPCELCSILSRSEGADQSKRSPFRRDTAKENNPSSRLSKKGDANRIEKKKHTSVGFSNQLEDEERVLHQANRLSEYIYTEGKTFLENLKTFLRPLLSALYGKSIKHVNMYFYLCMVQSSLTLERAGISSKCMSGKGREASSTQRRRVAPTTGMRRHLSRKYQRGRVCNLVEDYLAWKFDRTVHLLCARSGRSEIAKRRLRRTTSYLQKSVKKLNVWMVLLVFRLANAVDVRTFRGATPQGVTTHMSTGSNLTLHRRSRILSQTISGAGIGKVNTKRQLRRNIIRYIRRLLRSAPIENYDLYEYCQRDCFYIQRKNDVVIFNLRSKGGERNSADSPNVYYRFNGKSYFVHEKDYHTRRTYKIKCVNVCLLFYRYCFFFYTRNPLVFSFLLNRVFCVCTGCLGRYLVLGRVANLGTTPGEAASYTYHHSCAIRGAASEDATTHDCFHKQIGMLIKNRKNIFVRHFHFLLLFLIMRYHTLVGNVRHSGLQSCVPKRVMTLLWRKLKIKRECFSSPLNAVLPSYCSFFPDIDTFFGSSGNFFEFPLRSGAYEVNPPFDVYLINQLIVYILYHLKKEEHELTFFLVIPLLQDKNYFFELLFGSPYLSAHFLLARNCYTFSTRLLESREEEYISTCDCLVFILQNEKAKIQKGVINKKVVLKIKKRWKNLSHVKQKKKE